MSNWSAPVLSPNQKKYAALDAYVNCLKKKKEREAGCVTDV